MSSRHRDGQTGAGERTHLGIVLSTGEQGQLVGGGEVGPDLLHLAKPLPLAPFCSPVLKPHLGERVTGCEQGRRWWLGAHQGWVPMRASLHSQTGSTLGKR